MQQPVTAADEPAVAIERFRAFVLRHPGLHERLGRHEIPEAYVEEVLGIARDAGIALTADAVHRAIHPDPIGISRFEGAPVTLDGWPSPGWRPARSVPSSGEPVFDWAWFGDQPLAGPFFEDDMRRATPRPFSLMFRTRTTLPALVAGAREEPVVPDGLIFHMSRCGSTLAAQTLGADPAHIILSEAEPIDTVVCWALDYAPPIDRQVAALCAVVTALARNRAKRRRLFVKLDCWHTLALPLFRAAFPATPWAYLYRDPVEILVSQMRKRSIQTVAGLLPPSVINIPGAEGMSGELYAARALAKMGAAVLDHWHLGKGLLVDYSEMPGAIVESIAPHFGYVADAAGQAAMRAAAIRDAKAPDQTFVPDIEQKQRDATSIVRSVAHDYLEPVYRRLEALRRM